MRSEADMVHKFRVGLALQPLATALFANSPFTEGKPNGFSRFRSHIWSDTDPDRTGMLPFVFEDGFGYERYLDYALDVPMYFVFRDGKYIDVAGECFRDFLDGRLPAASRREAARLGFHRPSFDHLPRSAAQELPRDARRRRRAAGAGSARCRRSGSACFTTSQALDAAWDQVKHWTIEGRQQLRDAVPEEALEALTPGGGTVRELGRRVLAIAAAGLNAPRPAQQRGRQ